MKTKIILAQLIICLCVLSSCERYTIKEYGEVTEMIVDLSDYSGINVSSAFNANIFFSDTKKETTIEANENLHSKIIVKKENDILIVRLKKGVDLIGGNPTLNIFITAKDLRYFKASGAANIVLYDKLVTENAEINLSGASNFSGELNTVNLKFNASGASDTNIYGQIENFYVDMSGASDLKDYDLTIKNLDIDISGASNAALSVTESLKIEASGASRFKYKGNASIVSQKISGDAEVIKRD